MSCKLYKNFYLNKLQYSDDIFFKSQLFTRFVGVFLKNGLRGKAFKIISRALLDVRSSFYLNPVVLFYFLLLELKPAAELKKIKLAGRACFVPFMVSPLRGYKLAFKFFKKAVKTNQSHKFSARLYNSFIDVINLNSKAFLFKQDLYKDLIEHRAFMHFRWH